MRPVESVMRPVGYEAINPRVARSKSPVSVGVVTREFFAFVWAEAGLATSTFVIRVS